MATTTQLEALAWTLISGWMPKKIHYDTRNFVRDHIAYSRSVTVHNRLYAAQLNDGAPDVTGTKTWKAHAALVAAGFRLTNTEKYGRGREYLRYVRESGDALNPDVVTNTRGSTYVHLTTGTKYGFGLDVATDAIPADVPAWMAMKRAAALARR